MRTQDGFITVGVALMMMTLVSFNSFISVKGSLMKQQSANNAYYSEQSFQHAELGLNKVKANINQYLKDNPSITKIDDIPANQTSLNLSNVYSTVRNGNQLISTGYINGVGLRKISQMIQVTAGSSGSAALNALGSISLGGSTEASSAKAGGNISGNVPSQAYANSNEFKIALLDGNDKVLKDSLGNIVYRSMTSDEYFMFYFSGLCPTAKAAYDSGDLNKAADCTPEAKITVGNNIKGYICNGDCGSKTEDDKITNAYNAGKRIFWLENGGIDHKLSMGTEADPVLIFVMNVPDASQAAKINADSTITGVLYVDVMDSQTTINCSCSANAPITDLITQTSYEDDLTKPIYTAVSSGGTKCNSNSGCADSVGTIIPKNSRYVTTYQQKVKSSTTTPKYGTTYTNISLNASSPSVCSVSACENAAPTAPMSCTGGSAIGDLGTCSFVGIAVSGSNMTALQIEVTGTWNSNGSGNSIVQGAVITSGSYQGTGNATYIQNSTAVTNIIFGGLGGSGFTTQSPTMTVTGWSDMN